MWLDFVVAKCGRGVTELIMDAVKGVMMAIDDRVDFAAAKCVRSAAESMTDAVKGVMMAVELI